MGEVYKARDTRLGRTVAIKVLREEVGGDSELRTRFRHEAEAIAALKHPHICVLYDVGESDGADFLVMEHLEGETLAHRLRRGPLPVGEALQYALEIASAVAVAHRHGFLHRDLKPGNVMLTATGAKVLDFGLAKALVPVETGGGTALPTKAAPLTIQGAILGTLGYMAPEQLEGRPADARSDIFALGAILYEMATSHKAFEGSSPAALIAAVLTCQPPMTALDEPAVPALYKRIVMKCLAKDPAQRWESAADLVDPLRWAGEDATHAVARTDDELVPAPGRLLLTRHRLAALAAGAIALTAILLLVASALRSRPAPAARGPLRLSIVAPPGTTFSPRDISGHAELALSPDGSRIAFVAARDGQRPQLWVRPLASGGAAPLPGTEDATGPFWSPDGRSIAFLARGKLKKVSADGSTAQDLADTAFTVTSGSWSRDGVILFTGGAGQELHRIRAEGGPVQQATTLDASREEVSHRWPQFLPDGRRYLMFVGSERKEWSGVYLGELDSNERKLVLPSGVNALYAEPGYLLFEQNGYLATQRFELEYGTLEGTPVVLPDRVLANHRAAFLALSVAANGALALWYGAPARTELVWLDRAGREVATLEREGQGLGLALSADGTRLAITQRVGAVDDVWRIDLGSGLSSRVTFTGAARFPVWSPDGQSLVYSVGSKFHRQAASGAGEATVVAGSPTAKWALFPDDWSRDGRWLLFETTSPLGGFDIGAVDLDNGVSSPLVDARANQVQARVSPGGEWLAYASDESGAWEVYVQPFPRGSGRWQVSKAGGSRPLWRGDGKELFYIDAQSELIAVPVRESDGFEAGAARALFPTTLPPMLAPFRGTYAATADGQRFLVERMLPGADPSAITLILDWPAAVEDTLRAAVPRAAQGASS